MATKKRMMPSEFVFDLFALVLAVIFASLALLLVGGVVGRLSGLGITKAALRQFAVGAGAAAVFLKSFEKAPNMFSG